MAAKVLGVAQVCDGAPRVELPRPERVIGICVRLKRRVAAGRVRGGRAMLGLPVVWVPPVPLRELSSQPAG
jgi:hypothetical protein